MRATATEAIALSDTTAGEELGHFTEFGFAYSLNPFQAVAYLCAYLKENNLTKLDLFQIIVENRRDTPHRIGNSTKWGKLEYEKLLSGKIRYSSIALSAWVVKNKHHFEKVKECD